jgi:hypothetical protein
MAIKIDVIPNRREAAVRNLLFNSDSRKAGSSPSLRLDSE